MNVPRAPGGRHQLVARKRSSLLHITRHTLFPPEVGWRPGAHPHAVCFLVDLRCLHENTKNRPLSETWIKTPCRKTPHWYSLARSQLPLLSSHNPTSRAGALGNYRRTSQWATFNTRRSSPTLLCTAGEAACGNGGRQHCRNLRESPFQSDFA